MKTIILQIALARPWRAHQKSENGVKNNTSTFLASCSILRAGVPCSLHCVHLRHEQRLGHELHWELSVVEELVVQNRDDASSTLLRDLVRCTWKFNPYVARGFLLDKYSVDLVVFLAQIHRLLLDIEIEIRILLQVHFVRVKHVWNENAGRGIAVSFRENLLLGQSCCLPWKQVGEVVRSDSRAIVVIDGRYARYVGHAHLAWVHVTILHQFLHQERASLRSVDVRRAWVVSYGLRTVLVFLGI